MSEFDKVYDKCFNVIILTQRWRCCVDWFRKFWRFDILTDSSVSNEANDSSANGVQMCFVSICTIYILPFAYLSWVALS